MYLHAVNREPRAGVQLLVADVAFEMFGFLVLNENLLIVEFSVAIPTPGFRLLLLFPSHFSKFASKICGETRSSPADSE